MLTFNNLAIVRLIKEETLLSLNCVHTKKSLRKKKRGGMIQSSIYIYTIYMVLDYFWLGLNWACLQKKLLEVMVSNSRLCSWKSPILLIYLFIYLLFVLRNAH